MRTHLDWIKCKGDVWCKLNTVNLDHEHFDNARGVYIIWHGGSQPHVVYVGQGNIRQRLRAHRADSRIQQYAGSDLYVTWAWVSEEYMNGIEDHLISKWRPKVNEKLPGTGGVMVNSPW